MGGTVERAMRSGGMPTAFCAHWTNGNGPVIGIVRVTDDDEILMMTARGKIQRIRAEEISVIGRNTQGVRLISLANEEKLVGMERILEEKDEDEDEDDGIYFGKSYQIAAKPWSASVIRCSICCRRVLSWSSSNTRSSGSEVAK